ncbi:cytochrome c1 [Dyella kyungheensis]|jgi:ubiquinol-cytochrome c reductase cytochrome c1 subunit|uniref:Cytochrome c1 n=1 Tax=Dyella kyungheensis TaxID=1242174 RepID=A0ABS2JNJ6_9GAMM|nr:cytochrome c1 [Dyella kyungheensis]MBM7120607.1 cytochrome c1 [Dyella kyungheensis]
MKKIISTVALTVGLLVGTNAAIAQEEGKLPAAGTNVHDQASLQRGAKLYFNYCVGCHSLKYVRYSRIAEDLGLSEDEVMKNLNFTGAKFGDVVISHMPEDSAQQFFGKAPPDLSLEVRAKTADWVYGYLNSFYVDPTRPVGWNNTVFPNASMPFPLWELQGIQTAVKKEGSDDVEKLELSQPGKLTPAQYQQATRDLTNFLEYAAEPAALQRQRYGIWVLLFLAGFTFLAYLLKKEYWKDVH